MELDPLLAPLLEVPVLDLTVGSSYDEVVAEFPRLAEGGKSIMDVCDPYVSRTFAEHPCGLPPALLLACEIDPVGEDGVLQAALLNGASARAEYEVFPSLIHGMQDLTPVTPIGVAFHQRGAGALRQI